jgi:hypothetical protein
MQRLIKARQERPEFDPLMGGAEAALAKMATKVVHPDGVQVRDDVVALGLLLINRVWFKWKGTAHCSEERLFHRPVPVNLSFSSRPPMRASRSFRLFAPLPSPTQGLTKAFSEFDKDGNGYLDGPELVMAMRLLEPGLLDEEVMHVESCRR